MALQTVDDKALLEVLFDIFRCHGYEGTSISQLAEATGLKKSSLYHRFPAGKDDMVKAVIRYVSAELHQHVIGPLLDNQKPPEQRFNAMLDTVKAIYGDGRKNCLLNALSLGSVKDDIKQLLNKDYQAWLVALTQLGLEIGYTQQEAEQKAQHFLVAVQGALVIQRVTDNPLIFENCMALEQKSYFQAI
jgi:TetR/AcrR family transcriptional regulator, lmrAB and yxaGH operons repressor